MRLFRRNRTTRRRIERHRRRLTLGPEELIPDIAGEITGWRMWMVDQAAPFCLSSLVVPWLWPTNDWTEARCVLTEPLQREGPSVPHSHCLCGIYACATLDELLKCNWAPKIGPTDTLTVTADLLEAGPLTYFPRAGAGVYGTVALSGRVIRHQWGWRAEKARVTSILDIGGPFPRAMATVYDVPVKQAPWVQERQRQREREA